MLIVFIYIRADIAGKPIFGSAYVYVKNDKYNWAYMLLRTIFFVWLVLR